MGVRKLLCDWHLAGMRTFISSRSKLWTNIFIQYRVMPAHEAVTQVWWTMIAKQAVLITFFC